MKQEDRFEELLNDQIDSDLRSMCRLVKLGTPNSYGTAQTIEAHKSGLVDALILYKELNRKKMISGGHK